MSSMSLEDVAYIIYQHCLDRSKSSEIIVEDVLIELSSPGDPLNTFFFVDHTKHKTNEKLISAVRNYKQRGSGLEKVAQSFINVIFG